MGALDFRFQKHVEERTRMSWRTGLSFFQEIRPGVRSMPAGQTARHHAQSAGTKPHERQGCPKHLRPSPRQRFWARKPPFSPNAETAETESPIRTPFRPRSLPHRRIAPLPAVNPGDHDRMPPKRCVESTACPDPLLPTFSLNAQLSRQDQLECVPRRHCLREERTSWTEWAVFPHCPRASGPPPLREKPCIWLDRIPSIRHRERWSRVHEQ